MYNLNITRTKTKCQISTASFHIEFDTRYSDKSYITGCIFYDTKISQEAINEIESSKIVKVDPDFTYHSKFSNDSSILIVPQFGFSTDKLIEILSDLIQKLENIHQAGNKD